MNHESKSGRMLLRFMIFMILMISPGLALAEEGSDASAKYNSLDSLFTLYQPYLINIEAYEPIYFLAGADLSKSKFQISLKFRLFNSSESLAKKHPWVKGFHAAYTQTSFWDLAAASAPFDDTSYKPEFFFLTSNLFFSTQSVRRLFIQTGYQHESNGKADPDSRSTHYLYMKPIFIFFNEHKGVGLQASVKGWTYILNDNKTNPDLADYRGYVEFGLKFGKVDSVVVNAVALWARKGASVETDLTYPLKHYFLKNLGMYLHLQYTNRLVEKLIDYEKRTDVFRAGLSIVR